MRSGERSRRRLAVDAPAPQARLSNQDR